MKPLKSWIDEFTSRGVLVPEKKLKKKDKYKIFMHHYNGESSSIGNFTRDTLKYIDRGRFDVVLSFQDGEFEGVVNTGKMNDLEFSTYLRESGVDVFLDYCGEHSGCRYSRDLMQERSIILVNVDGALSAPGYQYRLADPIMANPEGLKEWIGEELLIHPVNFKTFSPSPDFPKILDRSGHAEIVFGCLNQLPKINEGVVSIWAEILKKVPGSRMLFKQKHLGSLIAKVRLLSMFEKFGIDESRIDLRGNSDKVSHMRTWNEIDIMLDTFPFGGHTTCCEAMWMGTPVVSLIGDTLMLGRLGPSYVIAAGHPEWVANTQEEYIEIAVGLAEKIPHLNHLRKTLRDEVQKSYLCNGEMWVRHFEGMLEKIIERHCEK